MFWLFIHYNSKHYTMITFRNLQTMSFSPLSGHHVGLFPCYIHQDPPHWPFQSPELHRCPAWVLTTLLHVPHWRPQTRLLFLSHFPVQMPCFREVFFKPPHVLVPSFIPHPSFFLYHSPGFVGIVNLRTTSFYLQIHNMIPLLQNSRSVYQRCYGTIAICSI